MKFLGRGGSNVIFLSDRVIKYGVPTWEPRFMRRWHWAFVPVISVHSVHYLTLDLTSSYDVPQLACAYDMPRLVPVEPDDLQTVEDALTGGGRLLYRLWNTEVPRRQGWKLGLATHLLSQRERHSLQAIPVRFLNRLIEQLPEPERWCTIHGDPTLANLLYDRSNDAFRWLDPLNRPFIPGDPHVDLGKMFQTCCGYERVLLGSQEHPVFNEELACNLSQFFHLDYQSAWLWCAVHLVRLLPYQRDLEVRQKFIDLLLRDFTQ